MLSSTEPAIVVERKFHGTLLHLSGAQAIVRAACLPDRDFPLGRINSIYFDTPRLRAYEEKANGDHLKRKLRLRWYGRPSELPPHVPAFLELKDRIGIARRKARVNLLLPRELLLSTSFTSPDFHTFLQQHSPALGACLSLEWEPVILISYDRERYLDPTTQSRISIDWNIEATRWNPKRFPWASPIHLHDLVCEFKNPQCLPPRWSPSMLQLGLHLASFSKYGECMRRLSSGIP